MSALLVGYARCSTDQQDLTAQRDALQGWASRLSGSMSTMVSPAPTANVPVSARHSRPVELVTPW